MDYIIEYFKNEIKEHNLKSGEIIFEYDKIENENANSLIACLTSFFERYNIKTENSDLELTEITQKQAIDSIAYGLSTKANYTLIDKEFNPADQNKLIYMFLDLFKQPKYYTHTYRLYQKDLDMNDFWESGGAIAIDNKNIGILWVNDLYGSKK